jgi:hypothetical protein
MRPPHTSYFAILIVRWIETMKKLVLMATVVAAMVAVVPTLASAATMTFSGSTRVSGSLSGGGSASFSTTIGSRIICTTHTVSALASDLSSLASTNTSLIIRAANNRYSTSPDTRTSCTYTAPLIVSGTATVSIRCDWILTATSTTAVTITITSAGCIVITFSGGGLPNCVITSGRQSLTTGLSLLSNGGGATSIDIIASNAPFAYTTNGMCAGDTGTNPFRQNESILVRTAGLSNDSGCQTASRTGRQS